VDFAFATESSPGRLNEDYLLISESFAIVLDGATELPGLDSGCVHGPRWLVRALGGRLAEALSGEPEVDLRQALATALIEVGDRHRGTCDLRNPHSPSATLAIVRQRGESLDYLVLCDSAVVFEDAHGVTWVNDDRVDRLPAYDRQTVGRLRNAAGGFWVASTAPEAAAEAVIGSIGCAGLRRLLLCTDGVSRLVEFFGHDWPQVFEVAEASGPRGVIETLRAAELRHPRGAGRQGRAFKRHDDATLAVLLGPGQHLSRVDQQAPR
jgi:hypothetical protein